jgi:DNA-binding response OmpR family regulator
VSRILIIDDNEDVRGMLVLKLQLEGFQVAAARNGASALSLLEHEAFDVIVTDLFMPDKDGIETIEEVRRKYPHARIVAMSGWQSAQGPNYLDVARELGAVRTLRKPFDPDELVAVVRAVL